MREMFRNLQQVLAEDVTALGVEAEFDHLWHILQTGTSAHRQMAIYRESRAQGASRSEALQAVVDWLAEASVPAMPA